MEIYILGAVVFFAIITLGGLYDKRLCPEAFRDVGHRVEWSLLWPVAAPLFVLYLLLCRE